MKDRMDDAMRIADEATDEFIADLSEIQKTVSFGYSINPGRRLTKSESKRLLEVIDGVEQPRDQ